MAAKQQSNIEKSTYKGLLILTVILISIFVFRTLLFSYEIHSYDEIDKEFADKTLFSKDSVILDSNHQNKDQKNIIKDLTVNQKIVNINRSLKDELIKLPGVGPKTAEKIIKYRTENGDFQTKDDLKKVKGIGPAKLKKIKNLIKLK
ncbi:MAG: helix-hairpin-helix domain-containing protein [Candidatus Delongbacteria bacterium]|jgi:comEA protein|nr:helix-hairpin-helix domain-containing protein [Candidatus Delongbacteria bacterium]